MFVVFGFLGLVVGALIAVTLLAFPHALEGVVHVHAAPWLAPFAVFSMGQRLLPDRVGTARSAPDGYRGTKTVEAPGFRPGTRMLTLADGARRLRVHVLDPRTAVVTAITKPRWPFRNVERACGTVRVRLVEGASMRRLEARLLPAHLALPLSILAYSVIPSLGRGDVGSLAAAALLPTIVVFAVWQVVWWPMHVEQLKASAERAMEDLESQLIEAADAVDGARP